MDLLTKYNISGSDGCVSCARIHIRVRLDFSCYLINITDISVSAEFTKLIKISRKYIMVFVNTAMWNIYLHYRFSNGGGVGGDDDRSGV